MIKKFIKFDINYVLSGGFWLMLSHFISMAAVLLSSYLFANYVSDDTYGTYKYLLGIGTFLTTLSLTGAGQAITQASAKGTKNFFQYLSNLDLKFGFIITALGIIGSIYYYLNGNIELTLGLLLISFLQPFFNNSALIYSYLNGTQQFATNTKFQIIKTIIVTAITAAVIFYKGNLLLLVSTFILSNIIINYVAKFLFAPNNEDVKSEDWPGLVAYAKHTSIRNIFSGLASQSDKILVFQILGAPELAIYTFAIAIPDQIKGVTRVIRTLILPKYSKYNYTTIRSSILYKSFIYLIFLAIIFFIYYFFAPFIFDNLYPKYTESIFLSQLYSVSILFSISSLPITALEAKMEERILYKFYFLTSFINILALIIMIYSYGLLGVILARIIHRAFASILSYFYFYKA